ncbi:MAG: DUF5685 family protein [Bacillota bacterium]|nr:DUF5685 family protein [Bacillota bacterium]
MFGYVRPLKPELLVREYTRYRSVYCGICRQIGRDYGQLPRLSVNYDLTLLALLLLALTEEQPDVRASGCVLNPFVKKAIVQGGAVIESCAALSVLLAWHKAGDQIQDEHPVAGHLTRLAFRRAWRKAVRRFPQYEQTIRSQMLALEEAQQKPPDPAVADIFGAMLQQLVYDVAGLVVEPGPVRDALGLLGNDLGRWIFLVDAIDDWQDDCNNKNWNPFGSFNLDEARGRAQPLLAELEASMDRTAALLPYLRDSGLLANVFTMGLPAVHRQVLSGLHPEKL